MKALLILVNGIVLTVLFAYGVGASYYGHFSAFSTSTGLTLLILGLPYLAATTCLLCSPSFAFIPIAILLNIVSATVFFVLGIGASTGIGGACFLVFLIVPAIGLAALNAFTLNRTRSGINPN